MFSDDLGLPWFTTFFRVFSATWKKPSWGWAFRHVPRGSQRLGPKTWPPQLWVMASSWPATRRFGEFVYKMVEFKDVSSVPFWKMGMYNLITRVHQLRYGKMADLDRVDFSWRCTTINLRNMAMAQTCCNMEYTWNHKIGTSFEWSHPS